MSPEVNINVPDAGDSAEVLAEECGSAITDIRAAKIPERCRATHDPLARGMILMLRCERARQRRVKATRTALQWVAVATTVAIAIGVVVRGVEINVTRPAAAAASKP